MSALKKGGSINPPIKCKRGADLQRKQDLVICLCVVRVQQSLVSIHL